MLRKKDELYVEEIDDTIVVFDSENEKFCSFENCAADIWKQLAEAGIETITKNICDKYEVNNEMARKDIEEFIQKLLELGLIYQE